MQLTLRKTGFGFVADDEATQKACAKVPIGSVVTREWRKPRNSAHHRLRFAWVPQIFEAIEHLELFGNSELLRAHLTLQTEFVVILVNPHSGEVTRIPKSWSYASLDEEEFSKLVEQVTAYLCSDFAELCAERGSWTDSEREGFVAMVSQ